MCLFIDMLINSFAYYYNEAIYILVDCEAVFVLFLQYIHMRRGDLADYTHLVLYVARGATQVITVILDIDLIGSFCTAFIVNFETARKSLCVLFILAVP